MVWLPLLAALLPIVSAAPLVINSKADMLEADLHATGQLLSTLIKKNSEFRAFAQQGLPIILDPQTTKDEKKEALMKAYDDFGPEKFSQEEKSSHMETAISTIEATKQQKMEKYFGENLNEGQTFVQEVGNLFVSDEYIDGSEEKMQQMVKKLVKQYEIYL